MRFENGRGMRLTIALAAAIGLAQGWVSTTRADGYRLHYTIPRSVPAVDLSTGQQFMAPPVPYGHYAKDSLLGCASCRMHKLLGCVGCGHGPGSGCTKGLGMFGHGGDGSNCVGPGCGGGHGWGHHSAAGASAPIDSGAACVGPGCGGGTGSSHWIGKHHGAAMAVPATIQSSPIGTAVVLPSSQDPCGQVGCQIPGKHHHGKGLHARCDDPGCGLCNGGGHGRGCPFCGGKGCSHCLSGLLGKRGMLGGMLSGLLHPQRVDYFVGAGGPVPITPGYVPYVVVTRSPRDFFSFPPMNPFDP